LILFSISSGLFNVFFIKKRDNDLLITSAFADSGDEDDSSPTENLPKIDKGKGRAVYTESLQDTEEFDK